MESKQSIEIWPNGSRASTRASSDNFTGSVVVDPLFGASDHMHATGGLVSFEPGARTAWHRHPAGQILIVISGTGWVAEWQGPRHRLQPGEVVWIPLPSPMSWMAPARYGWNRSVTKSTSPPDCASIGRLLHLIGIAEHGAAGYMEARVRRRLDSALDQVGHDFEQR
jgi:quercetin dioxygenase-like cupin family protein